jgi:hypothetical protein
VALLLSLVDEKAKESLRGFSYAGLVLGVLLVSAINAGLGWFLDWSPWLVVACPIINMLGFFLSAFQERPVRRRPSSGLVSAPSNGIIDPASVIFWGSDSGHDHHHHHHDDGSSHSCYDSDGGSDGSGDD